MMERLIEQFLGGYLKSIYGEGERVLKLKALSVCIEALDGTRKLVLLNYTILVACFLNAMGLFASAYLFFMQWHEHLGFSFSPPLMFSLGVAIVSALFLARTVRKQAWVGAFGLQDEINRLNRGEGSFHPFQSAVQNVDPQELMQMIEKVLDEKLRKMSGAEPAPVSEEPPKAAEPK